MLHGMHWFQVLQCRAQAAPLRRRCPCTQARIYSDEKYEQDGSVAKEAYTSSRVCSGVIKHCQDRGRDQGRSRPSAALHVVCTHLVALLQRLLCWPTVWRPHHVHVRRRAHRLCRTSMRRPSGWLWGLSSPFCAPRRSMVQADASHQRTTWAAASLPYIDDTSPVSMPIWDRASTVLRTCARIPTSRAFFLALKK